MHLHTLRPSAQWPTSCTELNLLLLLTMLWSSFCWPFRAATFFGKAASYSQCGRATVHLAAPGNRCRLSLVFAHMESPACGGLSRNWIAGSKGMCGPEIPDRPWLAHSLPWGWTHLTPANSVRLTFLPEIPASGPRDDSPTTSLSAHIPLALP